MLLWLVSFLPALPFLFRTQLRTLPNATMSNPTLRTKMDATLRAYISSYVVASSTLDTAHLNAQLAPSATRHFSPTSFLVKIGYPPNATSDNESYAKQFALELNAAKAKRVDEIADVVIDADNLTASARSRYTNEFLDGSGDEVELEFGWWFEFEEGGERIKKVREFVDSDVAGGYQRRVNAILEGKGLKEKGQ
jgi:hypothetical protein